MVDNGRSVLQLLEAAEAELHDEGLASLVSERDYLRTFDRSELCEDDESEPLVAVRLRVQVSEDAESYVWSILTGDPSYDQDHRGFWGSSCLSPDDDEQELVTLIRELVGQVLDHAAQAAEFDALLSEGGAS